MTTFVLIHGSWHGAWCWHKVLPRLGKLGHRVVAPDLPSLGRDRTPPNRVSLARWRDFVGGLLDAEPDPVVLVGHSRGGIVISEVAEQRPDRIKSLVYVAAYLAREGQSVFDLAELATESLIVPNMVMAPDKGYCTVREEAAREVFYGECSDEDVALARMLLMPEPILPLATAVKISDERFGTVPRVYIECLRDRVIPIALQRRMHAVTPCQKVLTLDTDHSPFFSRPDELVAELDALAR